MWAKVTGAPADVGVPIPDPLVSSQESWRDFEARIVGAQYVNADATGLHYEVGVQSNARLWTVPVTVFNNAVSVGTPTEVDSGSGVNGPRTRATAPFVNPGRTAKLRAAMIPGGQLFTRDGLVMYRNQ